MPFPVFDLPPLTVCPECGCAGRQRATCPCAVCSLVEDEPTCDICGEPPFSDDWNGETGCHGSCEAWEAETNPVSSPTMACECYSCSPEVTE